MRILKVNSPISAARVRELGSDDASSSHEFAVAVEGLEDDGEAIAWSQIAVEIDYQEGIEGAQFVIKNPNATSTCGCGSSFSA